MKGGTGRTARGGGPNWGARVSVRLGDTVAGPRGRRIRPSSFVRLRAVAALWAGLLLAGAAGAALAAGATNPATPFTNSGTLDFITFNDGATHVGDVTNAAAGTVNGTGATQGISLVNAGTTLQGGIVNNGQVTTTGLTSSAFLIDTGAVLTNGLVNNGTASSTANGGAAAVTNATIAINGTVGGSLINNGTLIESASSTASTATGTAFVIKGSVSGSVVNAGSINVSASGQTLGFAQLFSGTGSIAGPLTNNGSIVLSASSPSVSIARIGVLSNDGVDGLNANGGFVNNGTITAASGSGTFGVISVFGQAGGIANNGTITLDHGSNGIVVDLKNGTTFTGSIVNSGTLSLVNARQAGGVISPGLVLGPAGPIGIAIISDSLTGTPAIQSGGTVTGGVINSGTLSVSTSVGGAVGILVTEGITFIPTGTLTINGAVANGGTINVTSSGGPAGSKAIGIQLGNPVGFGFAPGVLLAGGLTNSGTINVTNAVGPAIGIQVDQFATIAGGITNTGFINAAVAIDTSTDTVATTIFQNAGALNGAVQLSAGNADVLDLNGGIVNGPVTGGAATIFNMAGGTLIVATASQDTVGTFNQTGGTVGLVTTPNTGSHGSLTANSVSVAAGSIFQAIETGGPYARTQTYQNVIVSGAAFANNYTVTSASPLFSAALQPDLGTPNALDLVLNFNGFGFSGLTFNQNGVASGLNTLAGTPATVPLFSALFALNLAQLPGAYDQLSGELYGSVQSVLLEDALFARSAILGRLRQASFAGASGPIAGLGFGGPVAAYAEETLGYADMAYASADRRAFPIKAPAAPPAAPPLVFWAQAIGAWGHIDRDGNAHDVSRSLGGVFTGVDRMFGPDWRAGIAAGYTGSTLRINTVGSSADIDTAHLAAYAGRAYGPWNVRTGAVLSFSSVGAARSIAIPGFADATRAGFDAQTAQLFGEVGYAVAFGRIALEPFGGLAWTSLHTDGFTETGGAAALSGAAREDNTGFTTLGLRASTVYLMPNGMTVAPHGSLAWQHAFGDVAPTASLAFVAGSAPFTIAGAPIARDAALVDAGFDVLLTPRATFGLSYVGELAGNAQDQSVKGAFSLKF